MRIFFPGLLLLVALIVFVVSVLSACLLLPTLYDRVFETGNIHIVPFHAGAGHDYIWEFNALLLNVLLSAWAASWAWERIRREKMGRID